jgi:hypothetical protein
MENHARTEVLRSALLFAGHFTLSIGVAANRPGTTPIYGYSFRSARVEWNLAVPNYVIVVTKPGPRRMERRAMKVIGLIGGMNCNCAR